ncbi:MAG: triose-phosphate isomerase [Patescibacteria group bacterium]|nr:triose-phosphate isomerase [Patescibacteria group bacterium]
MIIVNFKTYQQVSHIRAQNLARIIREVIVETGREIIAAPQITDLQLVHQTMITGTWAQHADFYEPGQSTGFITLEAIQESGATGVLLNHSEHKLSEDVLKNTINRARSLGLTTLVFASSLEEARSYIAYRPNLIGYEPPELIASLETSVARAKPDVISSVVEVVSPIPVIVGAGVKDRYDVQTSLKLGASGVAVSSSVVLSEDPKKVLLDLTSGY